MRKVLVAFLLMFVVLSFSELTDVNFVSSTNQITVILSFTKTPKVLYYGKNDSRTVHYFLVNDSVKNKTYLPVSSGTVEGVQIISINNQVNIFVYTLMPVNATYDVIGSKLYVRFPYSTSSKRLTANFINMKTDVFFKDLAEFFGLKIILYDSAKNKNINIKANNSTLEEIIRMVLSVSGLSYAYSANQTLYLGSPEEILKNFATFWQVYDGQINIEKLRQILGVGTYADVTKDKSKIFVFGGLNEYKMLTEALIPPAKDEWRYISFDIKDEEAKNIMMQISKVYNLSPDSYQVLEGQKKLALKSSVPKEAENMFNQMAADVKKKGWIYLSYEIDDNEMEQLIEKLKKIYSIKDYTIIPAIKKIAILLDDPAHLAQIQQILKDAKAAK
ncbi:MAG: hypothetical protein N2Z58_07840, partial [Fervidobacterium sp.]|nr:hypothetical protein [Fervidobacterium sp.]